MAILNPFNILRRPILSEKSTKLMDILNAYTFEIAPTANKILVKKAVEEQFDVKVVKVNVKWKRGKYKRRGRSIGKTSSYKEAVVTLAKGDQIDVY